VKLTTHLRLVPGVKEWMELHFNSHNAPSWRGAQLEGAQGQLRQLDMKVGMDSAGSAQSPMASFCEPSGSIKKTVYTFLQVTSQRMFCTMELIHINNFNVYTTSNCDDLWLSVRNE
jgi:hypothetical protein